MAERESQIATTIAQSKRLLDAGLDPKSADMYWGHIGFGDIIQIDLLPANPHIDIDSTVSPAWSLSKLWDIYNECGLGPHNYGTGDVSSNILFSYFVKAIEIAIDERDLDDKYLKDANY